MFAKAVDEAPRNSGRPHRWPSRRREGGRGLLGASGRGQARTYQAAGTGRVARSILARRIVTTAREIMTPDATCIGADDSILDEAPDYADVTEEE